VTENFPLVPLVREQAKQIHAQVAMNFPEEKREATSALWKRTVNDLRKGQRSSASVKPCWLEARKASFMKAR
jgi:hypothetical protein